MVSEIMILLNKMLVYRVAKVVAGRELPQERENLLSKKPMGKMVESPWKKMSPQ